MADTFIQTNFHRDGVNMTTDREEFAVALKTWRIRMGYTQKKAAELFNCSRYTIMRVEMAKAVAWPTAYKLFAHLATQLKIEGGTVG